MYSRPYNPYLHEASILDSLGFHAEALEKINLALIEYPYDEVSQSTKAMLLYKLKKYDELLEFCDMVMVMVDDLRIHQKLAIAKLMAYLGQNKPDEVIQLAESLLKNSLGPLDITSEQNTKAYLAEAKKQKEQKSFSESKPAEVKKPATKPQDTNQILQSLQTLAPTTLGEDKLPPKDISVDVPHDDSCLFSATFLSLLLPLLDKPTEFNKMYAKLLGDQSTFTFDDGRSIRVHGNGIRENMLKFLSEKYDCTADILKRVSFQSFEFNEEKRVIQNTWGFAEVLFVFRQRVVTKMDEMFSEKEKQDIVSDRSYDWKTYTENMRKKTGWAGDPEIKAIAELTKTSIKVTINQYSFEHKPVSGPATNTIQIDHTAADGSTYNNHYQFRLPPHLHSTLSTKPPSDHIENPLEKELEEQLDMAKPFALPTSSSQRF